MDWLNDWIKMIWADGLREFRQLRYLTFIRAVGLGLILITAMSIHYDSDDLTAFEECIGKQCTLPGSHWATGVGYMYVRACIILS